MKTLVLQAYQPVLPDVEAPAWMRTCCDSVRAWALRHDYAYQLVDRGFLECAPKWVRIKCGETIHPVTDLARLYLIRSNLESGYERVVWLDADVVIFLPENLRIDTPNGYAFGYGGMVGVRPDGTPLVGPMGLHNGIIVFSRGHPMLSFYIFAAEQVLNSVLEENISRTLIGPPFLEGLARTMPIECIRSVAWITPALSQELLNGSGALTSAFRKTHSYPLAGVDLCHFFRKQVVEKNRTRYDEMMVKVVERLLCSGGKLLIGPEIS